MSSRFCPEVPSRLRRRDRDRRKVREVEPTEYHRFESRTDWSDSALFYVCSTKETCMDAAVAEATCGNWDR